MHKNQHTQRHIDTAKLLNKYSVSFIKYRIQLNYPLSYKYPYLKPTILQQANCSEKVFNFS